ncbi:ricin-type beta-trefoil lectin domain protein [Trabulsiella odontotermitis]|uniref:ricin-type beta-trefoil lectin domain protein n=1 Tax=Trabulsiella odontotermitis TaxID=379893 RepID=UPI0009C132BC|nr:ricin-type beta-trefoil lectin domain protein [Trabulsiella odontotermitis]
MKVNQLTKVLASAGLLCATLPAFALEAWNGQEGSTTYEVIFDSGVYSNIWWVGKDNCPGEAASDEANNPWRYQRAATSAEIEQYGNPTSCEISDGDGDSTAAAFQGTATYAANDIVSYNGANYITSAAVAANSFVPGEGNPWVQYKEVPVWSSATAYAGGDIVQKDGQQYQALFFTQGEDPSLPENQNPTSSNGRPWLPMGAVVNYTQDQLNAAPTYDANTLYASGTLIRFSGVNYISQSQVQKVTPLETNPWKVYTDWTGVKDLVGTPKNPWPAHVYAPYVDFSLNDTDIPVLADLAKNESINHYTLAFIVSKNASTCLPTWGTAYDMKGYAQYSKVKALREAGGDVMVSIGGANNAPLAAACTDVNDLTQQYYDIVDNLNLNVLDFDIEGTWVSDQKSIERRNLAVKAVQDKWKAEGRNVGIWYTLPILPTGLTFEGLNVLNDAKAKGVELAGINVMTMDYGNTVCQSAGTEGQNIHGQCAVSAIENMSQQLKQIYTDKTDAQINAMMGTTPMIGYNDVQGEVFYLSDANLVMEDAKKRDLGMIGIWSMARDKPGPAGVVEATHSGLTEQQAPKYAFSEVFAPFTHTDDDSDDDGAVLELKTGSYKSLKNGLCIDASNTNGGIKTFDCARTQGQTLSVGNFNQIKVKSFCLGVNGGKNVEGAMIYRQDCATGSAVASKSWYYEGQKFVSQMEGEKRCIAMIDDDFMALKSCNDDDKAQQFSYTEIPDSGYPLSPNSGLFQSRATPGYCLGQDPVRKILTGMRKCQTGDAYKITMEPNGYQSILLRYGTNRNNCVYVPSTSNVNGSPAIFGACSAQSTEQGMSWTYQNGKFVSKMAGNRCLAVTSTVSGLEFRTCDDNDPDQKFDEIKVTN